MLIILIIFNEFHLLIIFNWYLKISKVNKKKRKEKKKKESSEIEIWSRKVHHVLKRDLSLHAL